MRVASLEEVAVLSPDTLVTVASAVVSLTGALVAGVMANRSARQSHDLERRKRIEEEQELAERILRQYRDPLLDAAHTLQGRLHNIMGEHYLDRYLHAGDPAEEQYARDYSVYAVAEYLCWVEILRRELRFLDVGNVERNRQLLLQLTQIQFAFQRQDIPALFRVFRGRQRAIAEVMMTPTGAPEGPRNECIGYAEFCRRLDQSPEFAQWFKALQADVYAIVPAPPQERIRLVRLQNELIDLIDFLDPDAIRLPREQRHRLPEPHPAAAPI
jgi:hypothetical protein